MLAQIIWKLKLDPTHQVWQSQHGELGSHAFPHLGSCFIGHNFADGILTSNLTNLSDLSLENVLAILGKVISRFTPSLPLLLAPHFSFSFFFLLLLLCALDDVNLFVPTPLSKNPLRKPSCATWDRVGEKTQEDDATFIRFDSLRDL